jgi:PAS domain S-box-containing protein
MNKLSVTMIAICGLAAIVLMDKLQMSHWQEDMDFEIQAISQLCQQRLESSMASHFTAVEALAALFTIHPDTKAGEFAEFAKRLKVSHPPIRALQYADAQTRVTYVYPPKGNEITIRKPMVLLTDPVRGPYVRKAIIFKSATVHGPFDLRQGGKGIAVRTPIFHGEMFAGLAIGVYDVPALLKEALAGIQLERVHLNLSDGDGKSFFRLGPDSIRSHRQSIRVADTHWTLSTGWSPGFADPPFTNRMLLYSSGALFLIAVFFLFYREWTRTRQLEAMVKKRTADLEAQIDERRNTEAKLQASETKYRTLFENMAQGAFYQSCDGRIIDTNPAALEMFGLTREQFISKTSKDPQWQMIHEDGTAFQVQEYPSMVALKSGRIVRDVIASVLNPRKNDYVWLSFHAMPQFKPDNKRPYQVFVTLHDISALKKAEQQIRDSESRFRELFDEAPLMYIITRDKNGKPIIKDANKSFVRTVQYDVHDIINQPLEKFYTVDSARKLMQRSGYPSVMQGEIISGERSLIAKDGSTIHTLFRSRPEMDESGAVIGTRATFLDITDRKLADKEKKNLENKLRHAQKMEAIGTLAGGIAHDFNNILASIVGYTELALGDCKPGSLMKENLKEVYIASLRARDLVKQILAFARQTNEEAKPVAVHKIVKEVLKLIRSTIPVTIDIEQQIESDALVMGNPAQIHQIILNLCTNAYQAMEDEGGRLTVSLKQLRIEENTAGRPAGIDPGDYLELTVSDTGTGIAPEIMESIFEPYFTTKETGEGTGMGLAVVHGIVKRYGGDITIQSELNKGAVFTVYLPIFQQRSKSIQADRFEYPTGSERILFVDDELAIARLGRKALERLGYHVTTCSDSNEALRRFKQQKNRFDLVITDMSMPHMTGDKLAAEMMKIRQGIPVILCTGYSKKISSETASAIGIKAFAQKPLKIAELATTVRKVLDGAEDS